jgi:hypothetical protein
MEALIVAGGIVCVQLAGGLGAGLFIVLKVRRGPQRQAARTGRCSVPDILPSSRAWRVKWRAQQHDQCG